MTLSGSVETGSQESRKGFTSEHKPTWCPGCGDFGVLTALDRALTRLGRPEHEVAIVSGIGCSSRFPFFMNTYGFHSAHGRGLSVATGLKVARPDLTVVATGGDGDALAIGGNHFLHTMRRNVDITYILMDNQIYGMTKGQTAPTSRTGLCTKSTPHGNWESPIDPPWVALTAGATFIAQIGSWQLKPLTDLLHAGLLHRGTSFINVLCPCVTFHKEADKDYFKGLCDEIPVDHDATSYDAAIELLRRHHGRLPTGLIYRAEASTYEDGVDRTLRVPAGSEARHLVESVLNQYR
ncbi:MAG: 2-oxoacid:ferredoxin oxidoreductase subunit beta [Myxococcales bacterium]